MTRIDFRHESATAQVNLVETDLAFVNSVYSKVRRQGHASAVMAHICRWADENGVVLLISAQGYGGGLIMDNRQLIEFYSKYGFVREIGNGPPWPARMRRHPSRVLQAP